MIWVQHDLHSLEPIPKPTITSLTDDGEPGKESSMHAKNSIPLKTLVMAVTVLLGADHPFAAGAPGPSTLTLRFDGNAVELQWPAQMDSAQGAFLPIFEVQQTTDLKQWKPVGQRLDARRLAEDGLCRMRLSPTEQRAFYRLMAVRPKTDVTLASGGEGVFGFGEAFAKALAWISTENH